MPRVPAFIATWIVTMALLSPPAKAQPPAPAGAADWDKLVIDALKEAHNKGADLYNAGDPAGGFRLYQGALTVVRPLLAHRPAVQKLIDDGFADVARSAGIIKIQAFRLHEVIEQVRAELKKETTKDTAKATATELLPPSPPRQLPPPKPVTSEAPTPKPRAEERDTEPMPKPADLPPDAPPKPKDVSKAAEPVRPAARGGSVGGKVTLGGTPVAAGEVTFVSLGTPEPRVFTATTTDAGLYAFEATLPPGEYGVMVTPGAGGAKVPAKYQTPLTSGLARTVAVGVNALDLELKEPH
jgi:hypothetical protein